MWFIVKSVQARIRANEKPTMKKCELLVWASVAVFWVHNLPIIHVYYENNNDIFFSAYFDQKNFGPFFA